MEEIRLVIWLFDILLGEARLLGRLYQIPYDNVKSPFIHSTICAHLLDLVVEGIVPLSSLHAIIKNVWLSGRKSIM